MAISVSIVTTTYNSAAYIERTVSGVLAQETRGLDIDYILSDDGSSDETVDVVQNRIRSAAFPVHVIEHPQNIGVVRNFFNAVHKSAGQYLAVCDSDDVWLDRQKLVKQVEFMESHPQCVLSYHATVEVNAAEAPMVTNENFPAANLLKNPHTSTLMIRRDAVEFPWPLIERMTRMNDQLLRFLVSRKGNFEFIAAIHPTLRVVREQSVFASPRSELDRRRSSLHNWTLIRDHFGRAPERRYLSQKVSGFQSAVNWLEYSESPSWQLWIKSALFDLMSGTAMHKLRMGVRGSLLRGFELLSGSDR